MRNVKQENVRDDLDLVMVDWKDGDGILDRVDELLEDHGLEVIIVEESGDSYIFGIDKKMPKPKGKVHFKSDGKAYCGVKGNLNLSTNDREIDCLNCIGRLEEGSPY